MNNKELREWVINKFYIDVLNRSANEYQAYEKLNHIINWIETGNNEAAN